MLKTEYKNIQPQGFPSLPVDWQSEFYELQTSDGKERLFGAWHRAKNISAAQHKTLIMLHGMGEHGGRYLHLPHFLKATFGSVFLYDQRGHGRSSGVRGHTPRFDCLVDDLEWVLNWVAGEAKNRDPRAEIHLWGHSMGGHVALRTWLTRKNLPLKTTTVSAPFLGVKQHVPAIKILAAKIICHIWGSLKMPTGVNLAHLSRDPAVAPAFAADSFCHDKMTPQFYIDMLRSLENTLSKSEGGESPIQFLIPLADQIVDEQIALRFFEKLIARNKSLQTYAGFYHEPVNEIGKEKVFDDFSAWVLRT